MEEPTNQEPSALTPEEAVKNYVDNLPTVTSDAERWEWCRTCQHEKFDPGEGLQCGLIHAIPGFEDTCPDYVADVDKVMSRISVVREGEDAYTSPRRGCLGMYLVLAMMGSSFWIVYFLITYGSSGLINWMFIVPSGSMLLGAYMLYNSKRLGLLFLILGLLLQAYFRVGLRFMDEWAAIGALLIIGIILTFLIAPKWKYLK